MTKTIATEDTRDELRGDAATKAISQALLTVTTGREPRVTRTVRGLAGHREPNGRIHVGVLLTNGEGVTLSILPDRVRMLRDLLSEWLGEK